ncbi:MAG: glutamate mutase L [Candidatus Eisenbacteria bacterium]|uniref:Glutamate mutase L n=1 Tax=Eiseniibacteriota bacterium TaxID=2212470 RepID=A0A948RT06_UNCEI|nr:glutamate mutase L [Candidatus Eisenbacteria bacterium]MBU1947670.1 glutamate mutase L [Candidatus Eisenbacteria bacterium]MBU2690330.1 glutamate mutase L [Candidatus Eisenbacteria bacterium]
MMPEEIRTILATDCGSTTTKAILIDKLEDGYRLIVRGEAPTTVEAPFEDVTRGVLNSIREVEELSGRQILDGEKIITPRDGNRGVDIYLSTSSAGGGLQMMVTGVVKSMTGESAQRAALGAGAIVMDVIASNDGRLPHEKIRRIRDLRPDMILLSGGVDGGTTTHVVELAEILAAADPKPRLGRAYQLPVIYAGNKDAIGPVEDRLADKTALEITENIRPLMERENLSPARHKIHELFMEHVMSHAPGYHKLMSWTPQPIMPTPAAVGSIIQTISEQQGIEVLGVDIGGATTDVFSVFQNVFNRTVSANLGMSYSVSNVLVEAGVPNVLRWIPFAMDEKDLQNRIKNKMIRPTSVPDTLEELMVEQAIAREALRLAFEQHKSLAVGLKGVQKERTISDTFEQTGSGATLINMSDLDLLVGSGGCLSHAPRRVQAAAMLIDAFLPEKVTELAVDSIFMMPQLGVLASVHPAAATQVFDKDCLIRLGTCIAPIGTGKDMQKCLNVVVKFPDGREETIDIPFGNILRIPLDPGDEAEVTMHPAGGFDVGMGKGKSRKSTLRGGVSGLIFDCRGRQPFEPPKENEMRVRKLKEWSKAMDLYPEA